MLRYIELNGVSLAQTNNCINHLENKIAFIFKKFVIYYNEIHLKI